MKVVKISTLIIFLLYWISTLLYVSPNNFIRVKATFLLKHFDILFFQNWSFFAPPPEYDIKLYYVFIDKEGKKYTYECISKILDAKKSNSPFNAQEEFLDYVISGSATNLVDCKKNYYDYLKLKFKDSSDIFLSNKAIELINADNVKILSFATIVNYAKIVWQKNLSAKQITNLKFLITGKNLLKFSDRHSDTNRTELKFFESNILPL